MCFNLTYYLTAMKKYAPLFLIIFFFGCSHDVDLLDEAVFVQKVVEVEIREPKGDENPPAGEVSAPNPARIVEELITSDHELAALFCNGNTENFSGLEQGFYLVTETSESNFNGLSLNELKGRPKDTYGPSVFRNYVLDDILVSDFNSDFTINLFSDLNTIRQAGLKTIIRFSYAPTVKLDFGEESARQSQEEVLRKRVLARIAGLSTTMKDNIDVISCVQIGFDGN